MSLLQVRLWQLSKLLPPRLAGHLDSHAVLPVLYASSWLLTCFAADFPLHFAGRVMDVLLTQGHQVASPLLKVGWSDCGKPGPGSGQVWRAGQVAGGRGHTLLGGPVWEWHCCGARASAEAAWGGACTAAPAAAVTR